MQIEDQPDKIVVDLVGEVATAVSSYRATHNGYVPREIFESVLGVAGQYVCCDIVIVSTDKKIALRKRNPKEEQGWDNQFHLPGGLVLSPHSEANYLDRILSQNLISYDLSACQFIGVERHVEPERGNITCFTLVYRLNLIGDSMNSLSQLQSPSEWVFLEKEELGKNGILVVNHHVGTIGRVFGQTKGFPDPTQYFLGF